MIHMDGRMTVTSGLASGSAGCASTLTSSPSPAASSPFFSEGPALNPRARETPDP